MRCHFCCQRICFVFGFQESISNYFLLTLYEINTTKEFPRDFCSWNTFTELLRSKSKVWEIVSSDEMFCALFTIITYETFVRNPPPPDGNLILWVFNETWNWGFLDWTNSNHWKKYSNSLLNKKQSHMAHR